MHRVCRQAGSLQVVHVVSMHYVFVNKEAVYKLWCQCIMCLLTMKQFNSCSYHVFVNKDAV